MSDEPEEFPDGDRWPPGEGLGLPAYGAVEPVVGAGHFPLLLVLSTIPL